MFTLLEIREYRYEMDAYTYFRWKLNRWGIDLYRTERDRVSLVKTLYFRIDLPFIHITNTIYRNTVSEGINSDNVMLGVAPQYRSTPVVSGKVLFWKIKIRE